MRQLFQTRTILFLITPALLFLALFFLLPLVFVLVDSVRDPSGLTLQRYGDFLAEDQTRNVYFRTLQLGVIVTGLAALMGYPAAYLIARLPASRRALMMSLVILPLLTNPVARTYAWLVILGRNGFFNQTMIALGLIAEPIRIIYTENAIVIGLLQLFLPLMVLTLVSAMENIPTDVEEAAHSLGAGGLQTFLRVILPLSADGLVLGGTLVFTGSITAYVTPAILGGTRVLMLATLLQQRAIALLDWSGATIIAVVMIMTTLVINALLRQLRPRSA
ncbi:MAG: ABC transporter permease [Anaerolineales bacterium]|nr:ABC transporter permease [Anaerolineales bacterium]